MRAKMKVKIALDVAMTLALLFLMGYQFWGQVAHEWAGAGIFVLFIAHHLLNTSWHKALFRGHYTPLRVFQLGIDALTLAAMLALMYSSIVISRQVFSFLDIEGGMALARKLHILGSHWGLVLMSLHLGLHWRMLLGLAAKRPAPAGNPRTRVAICFAVGLAIAAYGAYVFISRDFPTYLFLQSEFVFLDYEESRLLYYLDYLALMGLFIFIAHYAAEGLRRLGGKEKNMDKAQRD